MNPLLIALGGGLGAGTRFWLDGVIARRNRTGVPLGTLAINVTGSFLLGLVTGWLLPTPGWPADGGTAPSGFAGLTASGLAAVLGTGFLGGYTTFSAASVEAVRLARSGRPLGAAVHASAMLIVSTGAAAAGLAITLS